MKLPGTKKWAMVRARSNYPPNKRGNFAKKLDAYIEQGVLRNPDGAKAFLQDGDESHLDDWDSLKVSIDMMKDKEGGVINIGSKKQLGEVCFQYLGIKPLSKTRKGNDQFNEGLVDSLAKTHEWAAKMKDYNKLNKIKSSYIDRKVNSLSRR